MKKINKKISIISLASILTIGSVGYIGYEVNASYQKNSQSISLTNNNSNSFLNENKDILFNNKNYLSVADATDQLLASNEVKVKDNLYIGDLSNAIMNTNNYNLVNTDKLKPYDTSKLSKAYKTSIGTYEKDYNQAKKTMIGSQEVKYMDYEFNQYRSEARAKDAIISKANSIPMSYYQIFDPVSNKYVNINPLNKTDQSILKEIAVNSVSNLNTPNTSNNNFSLEKYYVNQKDKNLAQDIKYNKAIQNDWNTSNNKNEIYKNLLSNIFDNFKYNIPIQTTITPNYSKPYLSWWDVWGSDTAQIKYEITTSGDFNISPNTKMNFSLNNIISSIQDFANRSTFENKFNIVRDHYYSDGKVFASSAYSNSSNIFGYDSINIVYTGDRPWGAHARHFENDAIAFYKNQGSTSDQKSCVTFNLSFNIRDIFKEKLNDFKAFFDSLKNKIFDNLSENMSIYEYVNQAELNNLKETIQSKLYSGYIKFLNEKKDKVAYIDNTNISTKENGNEKSLLSQFFDGIDSLKDIKDKKNLETIISYFDSSILDDLKQYINLQYDTSPRIDNSDVIYTINYKGNPLFLLKDTKADFNLNDDEYNKMIEKLNNFKNNNLIENNLINISNNVKCEKQLNKNTIFLTQKNNKFEDKTNFLSLDSNNLNIDISQQLNYFNIFENNLYASLNEYRTDNKDLLKNKYGILQSIYYYNKNLLNIDQSNLTNIELVNNSNDIVVLWSNDQSLEEIHYGEVLGNRKDINVPLNNSYTKTIYSSNEELNNAKNTILKLEPIQVFIIKDHFNNIINYQTFDPNKLSESDKPISDGYGTNEEIAYQNALNKISLYADLDFVFYENTLVRNEVNKLYSLTLKKDLTNNKNDLTYTFTKYNNMYSYLYDYIKLNSVNIYN